MRRILSILCLSMCHGAFGQQSVPIAYRVDTVAGANPVLDRVNARDEYISFPTSLAVDSKGNVYYTDVSKAVVRKISPQGIITTAIGTGISGFSGDGGPASAAQINGDGNLAVDSADNLYFSEFYSLRLRKVTSDGVINTVAGSGLLGFSGDGGPAKVARSAILDSIAVDGKGNIYIATLDSRVRRVGTDGVIQTVVGTGVPGFSGDGGLATQARINAEQITADADGNIYVLDSYRVRKVTADGIITTIAGTGVAGFNGEGDGGPATAARFGVVYHAAPDGKGGLYLAEVSSNRIRHIRPDGVMETVAGTGASGYSGDGGPATQATMNSPIDVAVGPDGSLFVVEAFNHVIRRVAPDGIISTYAGRGRYAGDGASATAAILNDPVGIALDNRGNLFVTENAAKRIRSVDPAGIITTSASALSSPGMLATDSSGDLFFGDGNIVWRATPEGIVTRFVGTGLAGPPQGMATDGAGNLYIADTGNNMIRKVTPDGTMQTFAGKGTRGFSGDGGPATQALFNSPEGLALDTKGNLYVADFGNRRVRRIALDGTITTVAGNGSLSFLDNGWPDPQGDGGPAVLAQLFGPERIAVDALGDVFIGEHGQGFYYGNRIRRVTPDGIIDTIAGTSDYGFSGDGGLARDAQLHWVSQLAADASGKVYFADRLNYRVRVLTPVYGSSTPPKQRKGSLR